MVLNEVLYTFTKREFVTHKPIKRVKIVGILTLVPTLAITTRPIGSISSRYSHEQQLLALFYLLGRAPAR